MPTDDRDIPGHFTCTGVTENPDGSGTAHFELDSEFKAWFKDLYGLKQWSDRRFQQVVLQAIRAKLFVDRLDPQLIKICDECGGTPDGTHWTVARVDVLNAPPADPTTGTVCHAGTVEDILNELHPDDPTKPTLYDVFDCGFVRRRFVMGTDRSIVLVGT